MTPPARKRSLRGEDGAVLVWFAILLPVLLAFAAFVIDMGHAFLLKRHLQSSADAAALAAVQDLPDNVVADATARHYSASVSGLNERTNLPTVTTTVEFPEPQYQKVRVTQEATSPVFFAGILGLDGIDVTAKATASKSSTVGGTPLAVYVHELCGAAGNKGFISGGDNMRIEGGIHVNGQFEVKNPGFNAEGPATVFRPPHPDSPTPPNQGSCNGSGTIKIQDQGDSRYCTQCGEPPGAEMTTDPLPGAWRDWATKGRYDTEAMVKARVGPCTHTSDKLTGGSAASPLVLTTPRVYCRGPGEKFTLEGAVVGKITIIAGEIEINSTGGKLEPVNEAEPVLAYATATGSPGTAHIKVNPSGAFDWSGFFINRNGGININSGGVISPRQGMLEAEWLDINGANFTMLGTFADSPEGDQFGAPALEE
jgi:hypothetical protein